MSTRASSPTVLAIEQWIRWGILGLLALLPFHAFAVTAIGRFAGLSTADSVHPAFTLLQGWKEVLLVALCLFALARSIALRSTQLRFLAVDGIILGIAVLSLLHLPVATGWYSSWLLGLRTNAEFLLPFYLARSVPWNSAERAQLLRVLAASGILALALGLLHAVLPENWLISLGYSPYVSSFVPGKPIPLFHGVGEDLTRRWMSTFSGPNQYAAYLLLLLGLGIGARRAASRSETARQPWVLGQWWALAAIVGSLVCTGSRSGLLGAAAVVGVTVLLTLKTSMQRVLVIGGVVLLGTVGLGGYAWLAPASFEAHVIRAGSTSDHAVKFLEGLAVVREHPAGLGLGQAGPVSTWTRRFEIGGDGGLVSESWYLQIAQELGVVGFLLYTGLLIGLILQALRMFRVARDPDLQALALGVGLGMLGTATQALVLHTFADNAPLTLTLFTLSGIIAERTATYVAPTSTLKTKAHHALVRATHTAPEDASDDAAAGRDRL